MHEHEQEFFFNNDVYTVVKAEIGYDIYGPDGDFIYGFSLLRLDATTISPIVIDIAEIAIGAYHHGREIGEDHGRSAHAHDIRKLLNI